MRLKIREFLQTKKTKHFYRRSMLYFRLGKTTVGNNYCREPASDSHYLYAAWSVYIAAVIVIRTTEF